MSDVKLPSSTVSATTPDMSREYKPFFKWDPSRALLCCIRNYQSYANSNNMLNKVFLKRVAIIRYRFWSAVTGAEIPLNCSIGAGLLIPHPNGIVIHPDVIIGSNCLIFQQVTIGTKGDQGLPQIGSDVDIGAGAKILGNVKIGDYARIGANAVVIQDVAAGKTAAGIPAKIIN